MGCAKAEGYGPKSCSVCWRRWQLLGAWQDQGRAAGSMHDSKSLKSPILMMWVVWNEDQVVKKWVHAVAN
eukprot:scaffold53316_cov19-Tisochrysis_lutea.AAC.3